MTKPEAGTKGMPQRAGSTRLVLYLGMAPGVGMTYRMFKDAKFLAQRGLDVVSACTETHGRKETETVAASFPSVPRKRLEYRGTWHETMDLEAILARRPEIALIDDLPRANLPGSPHPFRYQDVLEILDAGISVHATLELRRIESLAGAVEEITGIRVIERLPDSILDRADETIFVDIVPEILIERLKEGKVYTGELSRAEVERLFDLKTLSALKDLALRQAAQLAANKQMVTQEEPEQGRRILVALSPSPNSEHLIRTARRLAHSQKARWTCLYVESRARLSAAERERLAKYFSLARSLGAEVLSIPGGEIVGTLVDWAERNSVSLIVAGKSGKGWFGRLFALKDLTERIIESSGRISVIAAQAEASGSSGDRALDRLEGRGLAAEYAVAAAGIGIATLVGLIPFPGERFWTSSIVYILAIWLLSQWLGRGPVLAASVLAVAAWNLAFLPSSLPASGRGPEGIFMSAALFLAALISGGMTARARSRERLLGLRESRAELISELSAALADSKGARTAARTASEFLSRSFKAESVVFLAGNSGDVESEPAWPEDFPSSPLELEAVRACFATGQTTGRGTSSCPGALYRYAALGAPGGSCGVAGLRLPEGRPWTEDKETFLLTLARSIGLSIERELLADRSRKNILFEESERLSRILLHSVSHEFRTPLTVIKGSASALQDEETASDSRTRSALVEEIIDAEERLNAIVENLLSMSRLESGKLKLKITDADPEELVALALEQTKRDMRNRPVSVRMPDAPGAVPCDLVLVVQTLANLLQNAARYTKEGTPVEIRVEERKGWMRFTVSDQGPGIQPEEMERLFDKFFRGERSANGGTGLGLPICKGIAEAHGGSIRARNGAGGGFSVDIELPIKEKG